MPVLAIIKSLATTPARLAVAASVVVMVVAGGATTFGAWTVGGSGNGYAKAVTAQNLTMNVVAAATGDLYPGGTGNVRYSVTNPNAFPFTITAVAANGAVTSDNATCTTGPTGVTFTDTTGLTQLVPANDTVVFNLAGKAAMTNSSVNACQGATFTLPVTLTATS